MAVDPSGNIYIADQGNSRIRRVDAATGIITTVAGGGGLGLVEGGSALDATLYTPSSVSAGPSGSVYVTDRGSYRIREVFPFQGSFTASPDRGYRDQVFSFAAGANMPDATYLFDFGDGATSTEAAPAHAYPQKGIYTVTLTASSPQSPTPSVFTRSDYICAGYVFSASPETATTAPFTRSYVRGNYLYVRVWARASDVDYGNLKSATVTVSAGKKSVTASLTHEGSGVFSGSVLVSTTLPPGTGSASFAIADRARKTYSATETLTLQ